MIGLAELHYSEFDAKTIAQIKEMLGKYPDDAVVYMAADEQDGIVKQYLQLSVCEET